MNNLLLLLELCSKLNVLRTTLIIKKIINVVCFVVPLLLIVIIMIDFFKTVVSKDEDSLRKCVGVSVKRLIAGVLVFFIPTLINVFTNFLSLFDYSTFDTCLNITDEEFEKKKSFAESVCVDDAEYKRTWNNASLTCFTISKEDKSNESIPITETGSSYNPGSNNNSDNNTGNNGGTPSSNTQYASNIVYYNQGSSAWGKNAFCKGDGSTISSSGCGATSLAMIASTFTNTKFTPAYVANWLCNNGHGGGGLSAKFFTRQELLDEFSLTVDVLFDKDNTYQGNSGKTYNLMEGQKILNAVNAGYGVILYIPGHYVVVGQGNCKNGEVYLYDGGGRSNNGCYTPNAMFDLQKNNKNRCNDDGNCGWKGAWAFKGK